jgi:membrane protease YdiL (CAAX protease family)
VRDPLPFVTPVGWFHLYTFGILVPYLAIRSLFAIRKAPQKLPDREKHFRTTAIFLVAFAAFSIATARSQRVDLFRVDASGLLRALPAAVAMYVTAVLVMRPRWRKAVLEKKPIVRLFMPTNAKERGWWLTVSLLAGISEEITWRGMQTSLLQTLTGSLVLAIVLCAVQFGLGHAVQGWTSAAVVTGFALGFQGLVLLSGSLLPAMVVHVVYDVTAGLQYGKLGRELGYDVRYGQA